MGEKNSTEAIESSEVCYATLEQWARGQIQAQLQQLLEEEVTTFLGRGRHERRRTVSPIDPPTGSRTGYGKLREARVDRRVPESHQTQPLVHSHV